MANTETRVPDEFSAVAVDHLSVAGLGGVSVVFGEGDAEDVGPFFEGFGEVGVGEGEVGCSVPAVKINCQHFQIKSWVGEESGRSHSQ